jgi:DNA-3-methyladenine glycosylase
MAQAARIVDSSSRSLTQSSAGLPRPLTRDELPVDTVKLARFLVGKILVRQLSRARLVGRIVETEAYPVGDSSGHAFRGQTRANRSLFLRRGLVYMYFIYGCCWCLNVSSEKEGIGGGVLIRALEPLAGIERMRRYRGVTRDIDIARGPGRLAQALRLDGKLDGIDLCAGPGPLWLGEAQPGTRGAHTLGIATRIGLSREAHRKLRFFERGSRFVSGPVSLLNPR